MENKIVVREQRLQNSPGTEIQHQVAPQFENEIDLRDLVNVIVRRKSIIIICLLFCLTAVALYTFMATPQYKAKGLLRVSPPVENFAEFSNGTLKTAELQQNTIKLLQSDKLALRVINRLDLTSNFISSRKEQAGSVAAQLKKLFDGLKSFIGAEENTSTSNSLSDQVQKQIFVSQSLGCFHNMLTAKPVRKSEFIEVFFNASSPVLAAETTNMVMDELVSLQMETKQKATLVAIEFLKKKIELVQYKLEESQFKFSESEKKLQEFAQENGIPLINFKQNLVVAQLEMLNQEVARARSNRIALENKSQQIISGDKDGLLHVGEIEGSKRSNKGAVFDSVSNDYGIALKAENTLVAKIEQLKIKAVGLEELTTQYVNFEIQVKGNEALLESVKLRLENLKINLDAPVTSIEVLDVARLPLNPSEPRVALNLALGFVLGLIGGVGVAFLFDFFDNTIKKPDEMTDRFGIPVLGVIPYCKEAANNPKHMVLKLVNEPRSPLAAAFSAIMTSIRFSVVDTPPKNILLTSILPRAGKSSLARNCGLSYLSENEKCLLIDVDLRKGNLQPPFQEGKLGLGLSSLLSGDAELSDIITPTGYPGLDFISSGALPPNPAELLSSKRFDQLLRTVAKDYDLVILDGPAYQGAAEILALSAMVDGVILVAVVGETPREGVKHFKRSVVNVGGRLLGAIINKSRQENGSSFS